MPTGGRSFRADGVSVMALGLAALVFFAICGINQAAAAESPPAAPGKPVDFDAAVGLALRQSPLFTKSALEIDLRHLDETDSRTAFVPSVTLRTRYFVDRPDVPNLAPHAYSLAFLTDDYNPVEAYFTLQVRKIITRMAILGHLQVIANGLHRLAQGFLQLDAMKRLSPLQEEAIKLAQKNLSYQQERLRIGEAAPPEVEMAGQELDLARLEKQHLKESQDSLEAGLKSLLGLAPEAPVTFDLSPTRRQVLENFDPARANLKEVQSRSFALQVQSLKKDLQAKNIILAKTRLLPSLFFGVETPDPLSAVDASGYYFSVGVKLPVWDGFRRVRDISRQRTILRQFDAEAELQELDVGEKWRQAMEQVRTAMRALKLAQAKQEVARLKARQAEIRYQAGEPLAQVLAARRESLEEERQTVLKALDHDLARLAVRHLSGDLVYHYVDESSWRR
ncbi:MAG: TolC family protein [Deltaproteobacteria bacterium]|nr:TolC family protein [Deltaproteobacteria bacterium]